MMAMPACVPRARASANLRTISWSGSSDCACARSVASSIRTDSRAHPKTVGLRSMSGGSPFGPSSSHVSDEPTRKTTSSKNLAPLHLPLDHRLLDLGDRLGGVEVLGARLGAVEDRVTAVETERVLEVVEALAGRLVARVDDPAL